MAKSTPLFVGLDVHKDSLAVARADGGRPDPPIFVGDIGSRHADIDQLIRRPAGQDRGPEVRVRSRPQRIRTPSVSDE